MPQASVRVQGAKELRRELRRAADRSPTEVSRANKEVAESVVLPVAKRYGGQSRGNVAGGVARLGSRGVASMRAVGLQRSAEIRLGGAAAEWGPGSEYGTAGRYPQFPPANREGHIIGPAIEDTQDEIVERYAQVIDRLLP